MTEYNNTSSYPDSIRAAKIVVGDIPENYCDYLYQRKLLNTPKELIDFSLIFNNIRNTIAIKNTCKHGFQNATFGVLILT